VGLSSTEGKVDGDIERTLDGDIKAQSRQVQSILVKNEIGNFTRRAVPPPTSVAAPPPVPHFFQPFAPFRQMYGYGGYESVPFGMYGGYGIPTGVYVDGGYGMPIGGLVGSYRGGYGMDYDAGYYGGFGRATDGSAAGDVGYYGAYNTPM
jgi:hypothetical protein